VCVYVCMCVCVFRGGGASKLFLRIFFPSCLCGWNLRGRVLSRDVGFVPAGETHRALSPNILELA